MQNIKNLLNNTLTMLLLLLLGVSVALFLSSQTREQPITQQEPKATEKVQATIAPAKSTDTPEPTRVITVIPVVVTIFPTPTPAPSPTPTPTFEPLSDKPIMGFVFKPPQEIPNTRNSIGQNEIVEWLSNSSEELLLKGPMTLNTVNIISGTTKEYAQVNEPGNIYQPVWLSKENGVLYFSYDLQTNQQNLWVSKGDGQVEQIASDVIPPLIPLDKKSVGVSKRNADIIVLSGTKGVNVNTLPVPTYLSQNKPEQNENIARNPNGNWLVYYNNPEQMLQIIDITNNKSHFIDFGQNKWVWLARWSPDGKKLALLVTEGKPPVSYSHLYVLEWPENNFYQIGANFNFVTEMSWGPNSNHLLILPIIDYRDRIEIMGLFITNVTVPSETAPIPIPIEGLIGYKGTLSWSPDGRKILVEYHNGLEYSLYRIDVLSE